MAMKKLEFRRRGRDWSSEDDKKTGIWETMKELAFKRCQDIYPYEESLSTYGAW
jgi:hypothetical protein